MSISNYPAASDPVIGANDAMFGNTWDQVNIDIETALEVEHTTDGEHASLDDTTTGGICVVEFGSYTGDGNDDRTITLADSTLDILYLEIWSQVSTSEAVLYSISMAVDETKELTNTAFAANMIQSVGTGEFEIGSNINVNDSTGSPTYFYAAYGITTGLATDSSAFEPNWVQHGEAINTTLQQRVPAAILSRFRFNHNDDGTHYGNIMRFAVGTYTGNGSAAGPTVTPTPSLGTIKQVKLWRDGVSRPSLKVDTMSSEYGKLVDGTYATNWISFSSGSFILETSDASINANSETYYYVAFGTD